MKKCHQIIPTSKCFASPNHPTLRHQIIPENLLFSQQVVDNSRLSAATWNHC